MYYGKNVYTTLPPMIGEAMNYYQHHIGDFVRDTARLTDSQCMAFLRMIWLYYESENALPSDVDAIAFKIGANASDVHSILKHFFFLHDDGLWHQSRCDKEILAFRAKSKKAKDSANARWNNANAMRTHSDRNAKAPVFDANQEPITSNHKDIKEIGQNRKRFVPPSLHDVHLLIAEKGYQISADTFWNFYESKGWMIGKSKMKSWQAAAAQWESRRTQDAPHKPTSADKWRIDHEDTSWLTGSNGSGNSGTGQPSLSGDADPLHGVEAGRGR